MIHSKSSSAVRRRIWDLGFFRFVYIFDLGFGREVGSKVAYYPTYN